MELIFCKASFLARQQHGKQLRAGGAQACRDEHTMMAVSMGTVERWEGRATKIVHCRLLAV